MKKKTKRKGKKNGCNHYFFYVLVELNDLQIPVLQPSRSTDRSPDVSIPRSRHNIFQFFDWIDLSTFFHGAFAAFI